MNDSMPTRVLVPGATGQTGRHVVAAAIWHGLRVRAFVRDVDRARELLPDVELVEGDLEDPATLTAAVGDVDAVVFTHGATSWAMRSNASTTAALPMCSAPSTDAGSGSH